MLLIKNGTVNTITQGIQKIGILIKDKKIDSHKNVRLIIKCGRAIRL